jgi:hypothetical protein
LGGDWGVLALRHVVAGIGGVVTDAWLDANGRIPGGVRPGVRHVRARAGRSGDHGTVATPSETIETIKVGGLEVAERGGLAEAPYPPHFPKAPGEPARVQPSKARSSKQKGPAA